MNKRRMTAAVVIAIAGCRGTEGKPGKSEPVREPPPFQQPRTVTVARGWFFSGCADLPTTAAWNDATDCVGRNPLRRLWLSEFEVDELETTQGVYAECVRAGACTSAKVKGESDQHPVRVRFEQAVAYCKWRGMSLPTEAQWEKAARGTDRRMFPWGNEPPTCESAALAFDPVDVTRERLACNQTITAVGTHPRDLSPYGALDMAGNAAEWTSDYRVTSKGEWKDLQAPGEITFADPTVVNPKGPSAEAYATAIRMWPAPMGQSEHVLRGGYEDASVGTRSLIATTWEDPREATMIPIGGVRCIREHAEAELLLGSISVDGEHPVLRQAG